MAQNAIVSQYLRPFKPNTHQTDAAVRFVRKNRFQRGAILFHSMGSGKTLTTVYILENYKKGAKWLVILPKGLDSEWTGAFDQFMAGSKDPDELKNIKLHTTFLSYKDLKAMVLDASKFQALCDLFDGSYVVCDEAHRILSIIRSQPQQSEEDENVGSIRPLDKAFALAKRIILVTGTPVQRSFGDLGLLVNIVAGDTVSPPSDSMFKQHFGKTASTFQNFLSAGGTVSNMVVPTLQMLLTAYSTATVVSSFLGYGLKQESTEPSTMSWLSPFLTVTIAFMQGVSKVNKEYNTILVDGQKIANELGPYISYYDALKDFSMLAKTPTKTVIDIKLPMTDFQTLQFVSMAHDAGTGSLTELKIVSRIVENDKIGGSIRNVDSVEDFIRLGRVIGNLSIDNLAFTTERIKFVGDKTADLKEYNYRAVLRPDCPLSLKNSNRDQAPIFMCPKYSACLTELLKLRKISVYPNTYMPVVYSCFDKYGFQTFSAFLTSMKIPHLIVHPDDDIIHRSAVLKVAKSPTNPWPVDVDKMDKLDPLCVLIHPTLTEGLSFSYNPAIFVLEMPFGYGVQEQIYARVIRTLSNEDVELYGLSSTVRFPKKIFQFSTNNGISISLARTETGQKYGLTDINIPAFPIQWDGWSEDDNWGIFYEGALRFFPEKKKNPDSGMDLNVTEPVFYKNITKEMANYRVIYYPKLEFAFGKITVAPLYKNLMKEPGLGKSNKDFVTQYLEDFKFGASETPDQWASKINARQAFDLSNLTNALSTERQKDINAPRPPPVPVPFDMKNVPTQKMISMPEDIQECHLYDPLHPNDPLSCNLKAMSTHDSNLESPKDPKDPIPVKRRATENTNTLTSNMDEINQDEPGIDFLLNDAVETESTTKRKR